MLKRNSGRILIGHAAVAPLLLLLLFLCLALAHARHGHAAPAASLHPAPRASGADVPDTGAPEPLAVWKDWIVPISDLVGMEEAEHYINKEEATWDGKIWSLARDAEGWRPYDGDGMHNPGDVTGGHYDHLHVTVSQ